MSFKYSKHPLKSSNDALKMNPSPNPANSILDDDVEGGSGAGVRQHVHLQAVAVHAGGGSYSGRGEGEF